MWLKENPNLKAATGGSGSLNPAAFPGQRRRNSAIGSTYLGGFPCDASRADTWSCAWQHTNSQPCVLISFMGVGSINQHFSLQLPQNPYVMQAQCQEISQLLSYRFFSPPTFHGCSKRQPRETAHPRSLTACAWDHLKGLFPFHSSNRKDSMLLSWGVWLCSSFRLSQLITIPGLLCTEVRETFPK